MDFNYWFLVAGLVLTLMALANTLLKRLPLSTAQLYLLVGVAIGPLGIGLLAIDPIERASVLERLAEVAVILSLFAAGLKLRTPLHDGRWKLPLRLATISMTLTVGLVALAGVFLLGLPIGAAVLLGAVLAPTDPVLASDVQIEDPDDRDRLRFSLTGEAGFNDGAAFPFVMLGLGLLGLHELGDWGWKWVVVDLGWRIAGGIGIGALLGMAVGRLVVHLRREQEEAVGLDDFLALGLVALSYGVAIFAHTYAFLAVFAAGLALRFEERRHTGDKPAEEIEALAREGEKEGVGADGDVVPAYMASAVLGFAEQLERIGGVALVILVGTLLTYADFSWNAFLFVAALLFVIRPVSVWLGLLGSPTTGLQRELIAWFGIRGIGSIYYLMYAENHGVYDLFSGSILGVVLLTITASVVLHGTSVTPIMNWYAGRSDREEEEAHEMEDDPEPRSEPRSERRV
ncbi:MAG: cation:proton antiporter [Rhodothermales bacterium]